MPPITIIPGKSNKLANHTIQMCRKLFKQLRLYDNQDLLISIGKKCISLKVQAEDLNPYELIFSEHLYKEFSLPIQSYQFQASFQLDCNELHLGPVIGLLTDIKFQGNQPHFGSIHSFCEELHQGIKKAGGFFYVFSYHDFSIKGYYYRDGDWISSELPLPNVIYNRVHSRRLEFENKFKEFRSKLEELNIPFFNDRFLSKWEVHQQLLKENHLISYIPETRLFSKENLHQCLKRYDTLFIKPVHGSQGRSIFKLDKDGEKFTLSSSMKPVLENTTAFSNIDIIYEKLKPLVNNRIYIVQQGIPLLNYEGRSIDFRVLCHKNHKNRWEVTSVVARISAVNEFVSNIARGAEVLNPYMALEKIMNSHEANRILLEMKQLAIEITSTISLHSTGLYGELGIDIGIDEHGNPWLIEVNSKPSKNFEDGNLKIRPSAKAIINFCTMLAFEPTED